ncbi:prolyl oligopeptidase family serine peptidase [Massilia sp. DJPM01]|uniref:alpha/beta hydrolase family protein n=1 Tax=Massilia sp. DJPM01 TaxID=3024404 RepID=UPI00259E35F9|nr:prolyl oligopeptidase family serine peptidase [Massilia sp. DJPM01]MDM5175753.1 prolyl oligopeptidase family serine peptidase [Massilia sp. DJPM01]
MRLYFYLCAGVLLLPVSATASSADATAPGYRQPSAPLQAIVAAPRPPAVIGGPQRRTVALLERPARPALQELPKAGIKLAGLSIDRVHFAGAQPAFGHGLALLTVADGRQRPVSGLPPGARIAHAEFSPDERWIALSLWHDGKVRLWLVEVAAARARRLLERPLNTVVSNGFGWLAGSRTLLVSLAPEGAAPAPAVIPAAAPAIQESFAGKPVQVSAVADALPGARAAQMLGWYLQRQLASVDVSGKLALIGAAGPLLAATPSPDGNFILASRLQAPFAPAVSVLRWARRDELWDRRGKLVKVLHDRALNDRPVQDRDAVEAGPRDFGWRADAAAALHWSEAGDGGDPRSEAEWRDILYQQDAPWRQPARVLARVKGRINEVAWGSDALAVLTETWFQQGERRTWRLRPQQADGAPQLMFSRKMEDRYGDPGRPMKRALDNGERVLLTSTDGASLFYASAGASEEGDRPQLKRYRLDDGETSTLWRSQAPYYERVLVMLDRDGRRFVTQRESRDEPPNLFVHEEGAPARALTSVASPFAWMKAVEVRVLRYQRADGVALGGKLYLPAGYQSGRDGPLAVLMWVYPRDFQSRSAAAEVRDSAYRYADIDPLSPLAMVRLGYAVLDNPGMPIVAGEGAAANDAYLAQLTASAEAAVDELVRLGVADRKRIAIGGHSYGAFTVANLLAHTRLFAAGIAESGAYNRSLTPFGFQFEKRTLWQAPQVYQAMSPFHHAHRIATPLLMIHGQADSNPGTMPQQSERLFQALNSMGIEARLVTLPDEDHVVRAAESVSHVLWERERWLQRFLRP